MIHWLKIKSYNEIISLINSFNENTQGAFSMNVRPPGFLKYISHRLLTQKELKNFPKLIVSIVNGYDVGNGRRQAFLAVCSKGIAKKLIYDKTNNSFNKKFNKRANKWIVVNNRMELDELIDWHLNAIHLKHDSRHFPRDLHRMCVDQIDSIKAINKFPFLLLMLSSDAATSGAGRARYTLPLFVPLLTSDAKGIVYDDKKRKKYTRYVDPRNRYIGEFGGEYFVNDRIELNVHSPYREAAAAEFE